MTATNHYRGQIQRATERLAQLQARELLGNRRREAKKQEMAKREEMKRRQRVADLVFLAGAQSLNDAELIGALLQHLDSRQDQAVGTLATELGARRLNAVGGARLC